MSKTLRTIAAAICALFLLPLSAQEKTDTVSSSLTGTCSMFLTEATMRNWKG